MNLDFEHIPELLTTKEVSKLSGYTVTTINRWMNEGFIEPIKRGGPAQTHIYKASDVLPIIIGFELEKLSALAWAAIERTCWHIDREDITHALTTR